jgi:7,8-dihydropterin-6-yl-methyl-4-(beta-D-ribofuranosyl)aminobenzene 5'-phosphate synthase
VDFKITVLCENTAILPFNIIGEHGFACFLETKSGNYLFDTGQGIGILNNAAVLDKDLKSVKSIVLSHGHYDHTGGLKKVLDITGKKNIIAHPDVFIERYWSINNKIYSIGLPFTKNELEKCGAHFDFRTQFFAIAPDIYFTGEIPLLNKYEKSDKSMSSKASNGKVTSPDPIKDDISIVLDTLKGLVFIFGCAHSGIINIIDYTCKILNKNKIHMIIGGTHLASAGSDRIQFTLDKINEYSIEKIGVSHCTGLSKSSILQHKLQERFFYCCAGYEVII